MASKVHTARAELVLARESSLALRQVPLRPDPLSSVALALGQVDERLGEAAQVIVDLLPVTPGQRKQRLRKAIAKERSAGAGSAWDEVRDAVVSGGGRGQRRRRTSVGAPGSMEVLEGRAEVRHRLAKLSSTEPLFALQVLVWARSEIPGRAEAHLHALIACFEQFADQNYFRVVGRNLGVVHLGADVFWRRGRFDDRVRSGLFRPDAESLVTVSEIAGLLKPPTIHCRAPNVVRSGGVIPPPPFGLPTYTGQPDLLPLGTVQSSDGERVVGLPLSETLFTAHFGRAGFGKALALDTPLPGPGGRTTMGEVAVGDTVFDERGRPTTVMGTSDVMVDHECYEVVFDDGSVVVADAEHLWATTRVAGAGGEVASPPPATTRPSGVVVASRRLAAALGTEAPIVAVVDRVVPAVDRLSSPAPIRPGTAGLHTTAEIRASLSYRGRPNHGIAVAGPLQYPTRTLPIDPYVLGVWLGGHHGDGLGGTDIGILEELRRAGHTLCRCSAGGRWVWGISGIEAPLRALGLLDGHGHIPRLYLEADIGQRGALLAGLMDAHGEIDSVGHCELAIDDVRFAGDAEELVVGLGFAAAMVPTSDEAHRRYRIGFTPHTAVFRSAAKLARQRLGADHPCRRIVGVRPVASVPVRCIAVDSPSRLYLAGRGAIPTHNTETAVMQFVALIRAGRGGMFLDPHGDALERISPCLTDMAERVLEINLARGRDQVQAGWNVLSMEGLGAVDVEARVSALASSFAAALSWDDRNTRALNLVTMAAQSLCELALRLPADLAPTIFQITTILANDDWRGEVLPFLSRTSRDFWATRFTKLAAEAITPVTNLLDRMRASSSVAALFGSSRSTYDVRAAMDAGKAVLACPAGIGDKDKLVFSLFLFDLFRATLSRRDIPPAGRRPFHAFLDECQLADSGQSSETVARMLREGRKFGLRVHAMTQQPTALSKVTLNAMLTNRSHLFSTVVGAESAAVLSKEWAGLVDPRTITRLPRYHFLVSATLGGEVTPPFLVRGMRVEDLWGEVHCPDDVPAMNTVIDASMGRRPVRDILADLDTLDERILHHLHGTGAGLEAPAPPKGQRSSPDRVRAWRAD